MSHNTHPPIINKRVPNANQSYPHTEHSIGEALPASIFPQNTKLPKLFTPLTLRGVEFKNRIWVSPMCMYSSENGAATDFHLVHIGQYALAGAGLIMLEATSVLPEGRLSAEDAGLWDDSQITPLKCIVDFVHAMGGCIGIQLGHGGRKASGHAVCITDTCSAPETHTPLLRLLGTRSGS